MDAAVRAASSEVGLAAEAPEPAAAAREAAEGGEEECPEEHDAIMDESKDVD